MSTPILEYREGKNLSHIFAPIRLNEYSNGSLYASTYRGEVIIEGLMRNAVVKANGSEVVRVLNLVHALGWATSRGDVSLGGELSDIFASSFDITKGAADIAATMICDRIKLNPSGNLRENHNDFLKVASEYMRYPGGFYKDLQTGVLLDQ